MNKNQELDKIFSSDNLHILKEKNENSIIYEIKRYFLIVKYTIKRKFNLY